MNEPLLTIFMLIRSTPDWLRLPRQERAVIAEAALSTLGSRIRHFDAEAFSARATDVVMFETHDLADFHADVERLRDAALFTVPYFEIVEIIPTIEDGFRRFERAFA